MNCKGINCKRKFSCERYYEFKRTKKNDKSLNEECLRTSFVSRPAKLQYSFYIPL